MNDNLPVNSGDLNAAFLRAVDAIDAAGEIVVLPYIFHRDTQLRLEYIIANINALTAAIGEILR